MRVAAEWATHFFFWQDRKPEINEFCHTRNDLNRMNGLGIILTQTTAKMVLKRLTMAAVTDDP